MVTGSDAGTQVAGTPMQSALVPGEDPRARARLLGQVRELTLSGGTPPTSPRPVIEQSWRRMRSLGLDPSGPQDVQPLDDDELRRRRSASGLEPLMPVLRARLLPAAEAAGQVMVVVDPQCRVLWREGADSVLRKADRLGFVDGSAWDEASVGTNAIGTSLVVEAAVQVFAGEHYADSHQPWTCAAAPLHDPVTHRLLGVVDLSGPAHTVHASTVALVDAVARLSVLELRAQHDRRLAGLRAIAAPLLARVQGRAMVVTPDGRVAAVTGMSAPERVGLPEGLGGGTGWVPPFGRCAVEPLPGGWLLRLLRTDPGAEDVGSLVVDLSAAVPLVRVSGAAGDWEHALSPRHAEILLSLLRHPAGRTAAQLSADLFGDPTRTVTVRAEISRLRRTFGPVLLAQPYRLGTRVAARLVLPEPRELVLPGSRAPVVRALRRGSDGSGGRV